MAERFTYKLLKGDIVPSEKALDLARGRLPKTTGLNNTNIGSEAQLNCIQNVVIINTVQDPTRYANRGQSIKSRLGTRLRTHRSEPYQIPQSYASRKEINGVHVGHALQAIQEETSEPVVIASNWNYNKKILQSSLIQTFEQVGASMNTEIAKERDFGPALKNLLNRNRNNSSAMAVDEVDAVAVLAKQKGDRGEPSNFRRGEPTVLRKLVGAGPITGRYVNKVISVEDLDDELDQYMASAPPKNKKSSLNPDDFHEIIEEPNSIEFVHD